MVNSGLLAVSAPIFCKKKENFTLKMPIFIAKASKYNAGSIGAATVYHSCTNNLSSLYPKIVYDPLDYHMKDTKNMNLNITEIVYFSSVLRK